MPALILVVEDERDLAFGIQRNLEFDEYEVEVVHDGKAALDRGRACEHDLIILDLMLPELDGMSVLARLRAEGVQTPVLILTARGREEDKVQGLRGGADDYLTKPFGLGEMLARVEAMLRRTGRADGIGSTVVDAPLPIYRFGTVEVDVRTRSATRDNAPVSLTPLEFDLLVALLGADGGALSRHDLLRNVWGHKADVETRTVDTHVGELRRKLEDDPSRPIHLLTVRKFGYRLVCVPPTSGPD